MAHPDDRKNTWILFEVEQQRCAIQAHHVKEMAILEKTNRIPNAPPEIRGTAILRDSVFSAIDLRKVLGMQGFREELAELVDTLAKRKQDHQHWVDELLRSVNEDRPFELAKDPRECAFGKWYDTYESDDPILRMQLHFFDKPHRRLHAVADHALALSAEGRHEEAIRMIEAVKQTELSTIEGLFDETLPMFERFAKEILLVCEYEGRKIGVIVDTVVAVLDIEGERIGDRETLPPGMRGVESILGMARLEDGLATLIDGGKLFGRFVS